jgi:hypothetical protein
MGKIVFESCFAEIVAHSASLVKSVQQSVWARFILLYKIIPSMLAGFGNQPNEAYYETSSKILR